MGNQNSLQLMHLQKNFKSKSYELHSVLFYKCFLEERNFFKGKRKEEGSSNRRRRPESRHWVQRAVLLMMGGSRRKRRRISHKVIAALVRIAGSLNIGSHILLSPRSPWSVRALTKKSFTIFLVCLFNGGYKQSM